MTTDDNNDLATFFEAARNNTPQPSAALLARIEAQGRALQPTEIPNTATPAPWWRRVLAEIGGWPAVAGLGGALAAGLVVALAVPISEDSLLQATLTDTPFSLQALEIEDPLEGLFPEEDDA